MTKRDDLKDNLSKIYATWGKKHPHVAHLGVAKVIKNRRKILLGGKENE